MRIYVIVIFRDNISTLVHSKKKKKDVHLINEYRLMKMILK